MTGLAYKEFKQNRTLLLGVAALPALIAFPVCVLFLQEVGPVNQDSGNIPMMDMIRDQQGIGVWIAFLLLAFMAAAMLQGLVFRGDDRKVFALWTAASPDGISGYLRTKYELIFVMMMLTLFSVQLGDWVMELVCAAHHTEWFGLAQPMILLSYVQIIMRAAEIPFTIRFGVRNGSIIKSILMVLLAIVLLIVFAVSGEQIIEAIANGNADARGTFAQYLLALFPLIALALYYLSYRISCRLYLKGAEQYDK